MTTSGDPDVVALEARVSALEAAVRESRQLHERLCDVVEVVTEVLVPATDPEDARLREALARLRRALGEDAAPTGQRSL